MWLLAKPSVPLMLSIEETNKKKNHSHVGVNNALCNIWGNILGSREQFVPCPIRKFVFDTYTNVMRIRKVIAIYSPKVHTQYTIYMCIGQRSKKNDLSILKTFTTVLFLCLRCSCVHREFSACDILSNGFELCLHISLLSIGPWTKP